MTAHPVWCSPSRCTVDLDPVGGRHDSEPRLIRDRAGHTAKIACRLWQRPRHGGVARVELMILEAHFTPRRPGEQNSAATNLTAAETRGLIFVLTALLDDVPASAG